jgi:succinate dehydrogenase hydrophobic anchor subunit
MTGMNRTNKARNGESMMWVTGACAIIAMAYFICWFNVLLPSLFGTKYPVAVPQITEPRLCVQNGKILEGRKCLD